MKKQVVYVYTDGACRGNPGPGGWAALLHYNGHEKQLSGAESHTTNNRMELQAAISALTSLRRSCIVELTTDSQYVRQGITEWLPVWKRRSWKSAARKPIKNKDLWLKLDEVSSRHDINWHWVRGHSGHIENEIVDDLARCAIDKIYREEDE